MTARYEHFNGRGDAFEDEAAEAPDREISLGTTTILGIFVALALVCGVFFGFGYSMGRKSTAPALGNVDSHVSAAPAATVADADPTASEPAPPTAAPARSLRSTGDATTHASAPTHGAAAEAKPSASLESPDVSARDTPAKTPTSARSAEPAATTTGPASHTAAVSSPRSAPAASSASPASATPSPAATPAPAGTSQSYVQVAAISHREDADLLLASLRRRGYAASIRQQPQDNLLHIQIGPLSSKTDADAMRKRLLADGYNAIVK